MIQSVDSIKLAKEISKRSEQKGITTECLIEVNIGDEENKTGLDLSLLDETVHEVASLPNMKVQGLMTVPPICFDEKELQKYFLKMHKIFIDIKSKNIDNIDMCILSMGMSSDYEEDILCGSNLLRIGSAIFGPRIY